MIDQAAIAEFAANHATSVAAVEGAIDLVRAQAGVDTFYVFWTGSGGAGIPRQSTGRARTLLAFGSPDAALAFAQRNGLSGARERPRLRRLTLLHLLHAMLQEPAIGALVIAAEDEQTPLAAGQLPPGLRLERAEIMRRLSI